MTQDTTQDAPLPTPPEALMARLDAMGIPYRLHTHKAVFTAEEAAFLEGVIPGMHIKNPVSEGQKGPDGPGGRPP